MTAILARPGVSENLSGLLYEAKSVIKLRPVELQPGGYRNPAEARASMEAMTMRAAA